MSSLRSIDLGLIDEFFRGYERGYVLDFSNPTFREFFARELNVNIEDPLYQTDGGSKGKRLRCFLSKVDDGTAATALKALWEYREAMKHFGEPERYPRAAAQLAGIIARLEGTSPGPQENVIPAPTLDAIEFDGFRARLISLRDMEPQARGYEFEKYLKDLFDAFRLNARSPFRLVGEQIDGSFELGNEVYLLEAKWLNRKVGVAELGAFHSKLDQKASWARGLYISFGGFSEDGLSAFGKGRRLVCMDGRDLYDALGKGVSVERVISQKVRRAAETGSVFVPFCELGL